MATTLTARDWPREESLPDQHYGESKKNAHPNGKETYDNGLFELHVLIRETLTPKG